MSKTRLELKVGFFVLVCLVLAGTLLLQFGRGTTLFRPTFELILHAKNVGGMKPHANVLMSGVQIGNVSRCKLAPDGKSVTIYLKIYTDYTIYSDARFAIEQSGFLGDQYVAVVPQMNTGGKLGPGSEAALDELFKQVVDWGGVITGEHGIGLAKKPWWPLAVSPEVRQLHRTLKKALDPHGILNPGKFVE